MQEILIVVDMQNDFVYGSLGTPEAQRIVDHVVEKIMQFEGRVLFTQDTHESDYLETQEGVRLPVEHCIRGTKGWELVPAIEALRLPDTPVIEKPTFGSSELVSLLERLNEEEPIRSITLVGLCTDICVISNALLIKAYFPEIPIAVDATCCAGVTVESHQRALDAMRVCQIDVFE
ncbi:MAG: cysteine hydrolase [Clostridiaceae bacterium]|jgi:nicotinamidase-related amidase|nr:cysteine hydrolase [Clostridiaceae bacterium]